MTLPESFSITAAGTARKFRFMLVPIISQHRCAVNKNAIVLPTEYQKYYGLKLLYRHTSYTRWDAAFVFGISVQTSLRMTLPAPCRSTLRAPRFKIASAAFSAMRSAASAVTRLTTCRPTLRANDFAALRPIIRNLPFCQKARGKFAAACL